MLYSVNPESYSDWKRINCNDENLVYTAIDSEKKKVFPIQYKQKMKKKKIFLFMLSE